MADQPNFQSAPRSMRGLARWKLVAGSTLVGLCLAWLAFEPLRSLFVSPELEIRVGRPELPPRRPASMGPRPNALAPAEPEAWRYFLDEETAAALFGLDDDQRDYDPWTYFRRPPHVSNEQSWPEHPLGAWTLSTNSLGLPDREPGTEPADLRILVAGDSHTFGACNQEETFPALLEGMLAEAHPGRSVEVLNAACGGFSFYNYLGTLLKFRYFEPDVFVVAVFCGNDFSEITFLEHWFGDTPQQEWETAASDLRDRVIERHPSVMGQCYNQTQMFRDHPHEIEPTLELAAGLMDEMRQVCAAEGIELVVVTIPSPCTLEWPEPKRAIGRVREFLELGMDDLALDRSMERDFLARLAALGIETIDLRSTFSTHPRPPYWHRDLHLDLDGHRLVAEALLPLVR